MNTRIRSVYKLTLVVFLMGPVSEVTARIPKYLAPTAAYALARGDQDIATLALRWIYTNEGNQELLQLAKEGNWQDDTVLFRQGNKFPKDSSRLFQCIVCRLFPSSMALMAILDHSSNLGFQALIQKALGQKTADNEKLFSPALSLPEMAKLLLALPLSSPKKTADVVITSLSSEYKVENIPVLSKNCCASNDAYKQLYGVASNLAVLFSTRLDATTDIAAIRQKAQAAVIAFVLDIEDDITELFPMILDEFLEPLKKDIQDCENTLQEKTKEIEGILQGGKESYAAHKGELQAWIEAYEPYNHRPTTNSVAQSPGAMELVRQHTHGSKRKQELNVKADCAETALKHLITLCCTGGGHSPLQFDPTVALDQDIKQALSHIYNPIRLATENGVAGRSAWRSILNLVSNTWNGAFLEGTGVVRDLLRICTTEDGFLQGNLSALVAMMIAMLRSDHAVALADKFITLLDPVVDGKYRVDYLFDQNSKTAALSPEDFKYVQEKMEEMAQLITEVLVTMNPALVVKPTTSVHNFTKTSWPFHMLTLDICNSKTFIKHTITIGTQNRHAEIMECTAEALDPGFFDAPKDSS
ncbi:hypothetical protein AGMMS49949_06660 [Alphaproteobacteria bacterium]|nr:hypothetical protein AGMMS49949_06660 [Alphaproteobacteria bacterium]GHS98046.1 hypothetical protein AGMMS50296_5480 [Alphaproteobacteria bacterium]